MRSNKKAPVRRPVCAEGELPLDTSRGAGLLWNCEEPDVGKILPHIVVSATPPPTSGISPLLLCSGLVERYQFKSYPKPDRTDPPSVKLVTLLVLAVTCLQVKGTHPHKAWSGIQAVERGGSYV